MQNDNTYENKLAEEVFPEGSQYATKKHNRRSLLVVISYSQDYFFSHI
ncbi:hypothetical protein [Paenisporosarcina sp.]